VFKIDVREAHALVDSPDDTHRARTEETTIDDDRRSQRADARRNVERILDAAERCLAQDPDAPMADIAAAAGLGRVTVYGHFASRALLVEAVVQRALTAADAALADVDLTGDAAGAFERLVEATWQVTSRTGRLLVAAEKALPAETVRAAHQGGLEDRVRGLLAAAQRDGAVRADLSVDWLTAVLHAVLHTAATEVDAGRLTAQDAPSTITRTMLAVLAPDSGARGGRR